MKLDPQYDKEVCSLLEDFKNNISESAIKSSIEMIFKGADVLPNREDFLSDLTIVIRSL
jgi:hypothetical protein